MADDIFERVALEAGPRQAEVLRIAYEALLAAEADDAADVGTALDKLDALAMTNAEAFGVVCGWTAAVAVALGADGCTVAETQWSEGVSPGDVEPALEIAVTVFTAVINRDLDGACELWRTLDGETPAAVALHVLRLAATCTQDYRRRWAQ